MAVRMKRRAKIVLDMTPMVDIAFLLVIFFMATYHARPPTTVSVNLPESHSPFKVPEANVMVVNVLDPVHAKQLSDSIGPTNMMTLIANIKEASAQPNVTVEAMRGMTNTLLPMASQALLEEIATAPGKPLTRGRAAELAIREVQRPNNFIYRLAKQELLGLTPEQMSARIDSMVIWYATGRDAAQPLPLGEVANTIRDERTHNTKLMMILMVDRKCLSGKMLDLTSILSQEDVKMLRYSLVTSLKADAKPMFGEEGGR